MSYELKHFLSSKGISTSRTTPYHPIGNGQVEKMNHTVWRAVTLSLRSKNLPQSHWQEVLPDVLHSIRTLLCTATNCTPHEKLFNFQRRSGTGTSLPSWLLEPGKVLLRNFVRSSKQEPLVDEVELLEANPHYAHIRFPDGRETTVSVRDLAPIGERQEVVTPAPGIDLGEVVEEQVPVVITAEVVDVLADPAQQGGDAAVERGVEAPPANEIVPIPELRRSSRISKPPSRLQV